MATYDGKTALVIVDVQSDFADADGGLYVSNGEQVVPAINEEIRKAKTAGAYIVYTQDWHPPSTPHFEKDGGIWPVHCVQGTWGAEFHPALLVDGPVVRKGSHGEDGYSGFTMRDPQSEETIPTELDDLLRAENIERLVIVGLATDYCVRFTALDGLENGYEVEVLSGAVRAVDLSEGDGEAALAEIVAAGGKVG